jgi:hypothetical protein
MLLYRFEANPTTIAGEWAGNAIDQAGHFLAQTYVRAASPTTKFDVAIIDYAGRIIRRFITCTEILNDITDVPVSGIVTLKITNATVDEEFEVMMCFYTT